MEITKPVPISSLGALKRTATKIFRFRRSAILSGVSDIDDQKRISNLGEYFSGIMDSDISAKAKDKALPEEFTVSTTTKCSSDELDIESLLAKIFTSVSAIKAAYAQLQVAESPYDPDDIQSSDQAVVAELKHLSGLKQCFYFKKQQCQAMLPPDTPVLALQLQEQRNLLETYQITTRTLDSSLRSKNAEIQFLQAQLLDLARLNHSLKSRLLPCRFLPLVELHCSPDASHFVVVLRSAVKSVKNFVQRMVSEMKSAGLDLETAAGVIQPVVRGQAEHWTHAFESFVCRCMFSHFQKRNFGIPSLDGRASQDCRRFFQDFVELNSAKLVGTGAEELGKFIRTKYLSLVHPKMEASFFGNLNRRAATSSGQGFPECEFYALFTEMAKQVWLLHCLYFSYGLGVEVAIFQVKQGSPFSEVYMKSVPSSRFGLSVGFTVEFTVVPGFRVGKTLIQCQVFLSEVRKANGRP